MSLHKNLGEMLNMDLGEKIEPSSLPVLQEAEPPSKEVTVAEKQDDVVLDRKYQESEDRLERILADGTSALEAAKAVAEESEQHSSFAAYAKLMETVSKIQHDYLDIAERRRGLRREIEQAEEEAKPTTVNNTLVINGTTTDIQRMISEEE